MKMFLSNKVNRPNRYAMPQNAVIVGAILFGMFFSLQVKAQGSPYKLHALFIYNFTKYINWQNPTDKFVVGVYGKSEIMPELTSYLSGKKVDGKEVEVKLINSLPEAGNCQIVYLPAARSRHIAELTTALQGKNTLVISEEDLAEKGASISFFILEDKLKFKVNAAKLKDAGLQISSSLLSSAVVI